MSLPYLLVSLPHLMFDTPAPISAEAFVTACREQLSEKDAATAEALVNGAQAFLPVATDEKRGTQARMPVLRWWQEKETLIRNAIAENRNVRRGKSKDFATRPVETESFDIEKGVAAAFELPDPASRDLALERLRWDAAEALQGFDPMAPNAVFAYAVKLRMCLRNAAMTREAGLALAEKFLNAPLPRTAEEKGTDDE